MYSAKKNLLKGTLLAHSLSVDKTMFGGLRVMSVGYMLDFTANYVNNYYG